MNELEKEICLVTGASNCELGDRVQSLWSGYGVIQRAKLDGRPIMIKHIDVSTARTNRRGWQTKFAHDRKVRSYQVEVNFYGTYADRCSTICRVAKLLGHSSTEAGNNWLLVLEDLDFAGFGARRDSLSDRDLRSCLGWLASFHARFILQEPLDLWETGTYWHLDTRPDELDSMRAGKLKSLASAIDAKLNSCHFKSFVHGDAKVANFCFSDSPVSCDRVAAVDFQYVGGGCGMKDVAYFFSSCLSDVELENQEEELLDHYFETLQRVLNNQTEVDFAALESEWREMYPFAWADFSRFLQGWSPGHWKLGRHAQRLTDQAIAQLT